jgi:TetR/AcrR family transcriptional regulator, cholesterol catabolism regulator
MSARSTKGQKMGRGTRGARAPRLKPGVKREQILEVAIEAFGRDGYEETKWADIAAAVDIGSTALYHYFESKQHCLFEIMAKAVADFRERFERITAEHDDWADALIAVLEDQFDLTDQEVLRQRVLVAEIGRLAVRRSLPREEAARTTARSHVRDLEFAWGAFLARGMQQGVVPESDPRLLTRSLLGLYNSIWHWYRPGGPLGLDGVRRFFIGRELALLGCAPELQERLAA